MRFPRSLIAVLVVAAPSAAAAQRIASAHATPTPVPPGSASEAARTSAAATFAATAPVIDGRDDDAVWSTAQVIRDFRMFDPVDDGDPRFATEARVAYDAENLYVFVRAFDPHPDSIIGLLSRRDEKTQSDQLKIMIDAYHDGRTGVELAVNPSGVKRDYAILNDIEEDGSWDAVWDVATRVDSLGWTAEFRVPLSQLRFNPDSSNTFGFGVWRDVARYNERYGWPLYLRKRPGLASQLGTITGLKGLRASTRLEVAPYTVARTWNAPRAAGFAQQSHVTAGADLKYGITSNLTLTGTINPDFGQVEADPAVLNLSAFETFFPEQRPFFLEGQSNFRFDLNCSDSICSGLFYSRRIGRAPQLGGVYADPSNPTASAIMSAGKVTGRLANDVTVGALDAVTQRETSTGGRTIEPQTNYFVGRAQREFDHGGSSVGFMITDVHRDMDQFTAPYLRGNASVGGVDGRYQFGGGNFELRGNAAFSQVTGSQQAIALTQQSTVHNYLRPDDDIAYDPTRTSLSGYTGQFSVNKLGGGMTRGTVVVQGFSPGFEVNDVGFLSHANQADESVWIQVHQDNPGHLYRAWNLNFNHWADWSWDGTPTDLGGNVNYHLELPNSMWLHMGEGVNNAGGTLCAVCMRGGPAVRADLATNGWFEVDGDPRWKLMPSMPFNWSTGDAGRSSSWNVSPSTTFRFSSRFVSTIAYSFSHTINATQYNGTFGVVGSDTTHYTIARLDQTTRAVTLRMSFTATPTLSFQVYAQPFASRGDYSDWLQVANARAGQWTDRYAAYDGGDPGAFQVSQYRSNAVVRWEYRPGSVLYLVWTQQRDQDISGALARTGAFGLDQLPDAHPLNVLLIKGSYWLNF